MNPLGCPLRKKPDSEEIDANDTFESLQSKSAGFFKLPKQVLEITAFSGKQYEKPDHINAKKGNEHCAELTKYGKYDMLLA